MFTLGVLVWLTGVNLLGAEREITRAVVENSSHSAIVTELHNRATLLHRQSRFQEAYPILVDALRLAESSPELACTVVVNLLTNLGVNYQERAQFVEAERTYQRAMSVWEDCCADDSPQSAMSQKNLGTLAMALGHLDVAEPLFRAALVVYVREYGEDSVKTAGVQDNLAQVLQAVGQYLASEALRVKVLATRERQFGPRDIEVARALVDLSDIHMLMREVDRSEQEARRALLIAKRPPQNEPMVSSSLMSLANALRLQGRAGEAEICYRTALPLVEKEYGVSHPRAASVLFNMAGAYFDQKRYKEAEGLVKRALDIRERAFAPNDPVVAVTLDAYAQILHKLHRPEADEVAARAKAASRNFANR